MSAYRLQRPNPLDLLTARLVPIDRPARAVGNGVTERFEPWAFYGAQLRPDRVVLLNGHDGEQLGQAVRIDVEGGWLVGDFEACEPLSYAVRSAASPDLAPALSIGFRPLRTTRRGHVDYIERVDLRHVAIVDQAAYPDARFTRAVWWDHGQLRTWPEPPAAPRLRSTTPPYPPTTMVAARRRGWSAASWRTPGAPLG